MPTYQYRCTQCGTELEAVQKFSDPVLTDCPSCDGTLRKVYSAVGVVFKGSGFYATDSRTKGRSQAATTGDSSSTSSTSASSATSSSASDTNTTSTSSGSSATASAPASA